MKEDFIRKFPITFRAESAFVVSNAGFEPTTLAVITEAIIHGDITDE